MKIEKLLLELEALSEKGGYTIRKERGAFRGDQCIIEGEKLVVINKNRPPELQAAILAKVIKSVNTDDLFIKPAVRKELEQIWKRLDRFDSAEKQLEGE
ncbi:MAG: hypothetical protein JJU13_20610 [Balneolaceae bacterium]|jgi:hypothetical protein|nr:hypothetical protein [Balneolaceae bacterium]